MITRKYDKDIETLRTHFPNADSFTAQYHDTHAHATITHGTDCISISMVGYSDGRTGYVLNGDMKFDTLADLLTYMDGGKAA
mgnify:CR=1 FL=1